MKRNTEIDTLLEKLVAACGFDASESASEEFLDILIEQAIRVKGRAEYSREEQCLCYDCTHVLSRFLQEACLNVFAPVGK